MPTLPRRCSVPGCVQIQPCDIHRRQQAPNPHASAYDRKWYAKVKAAIARQPYCTYCGAVDNLEGDHPIPLSMGGSQHQDPVVACRKCNASKGGANRVRREQHG